MLTAKDINFKGANGFENILDIFYPVGSIFTTISETSPASHLGGTWVKIENALLAAAGDNYAAVNTNDGLMKITTNQLPSHNHTMAHTHALNGSKAAANSNGAHFHSLTNNHTGAYLLGMYDETGANANYYGRRSTPSGSSCSFVGFPYSEKLHGYGMKNTPSAGAHTHTLTGNTAASSAANTGNIGGGRTLYHTITVCMYIKELLKGGDDTC